jgi:hypothetical protein
VSRRLVVAAAVVFAALVAAGGWLLTGGTTAPGSSLHRGPSGLLAARLYLEASGAEVRLLDRPLDASADGAVLLVALPFQHGTFDFEPDALDRHLGRGGVVVVAYGGRRWSAAEWMVLGALGLGSEDAREKPPLGPFAWRRWAAEEWTITPEPDLALRDPLRISALERLPVPPRGARVLYREPGGRAVVFEYRRRGGRVVMLPAELISNGRIGQAGHASLLQGLRALGDAWAFDEYHHGLAGAAAPEAVHTRHVLDLYAAHLLFLYVVAVLTVVRRFGPAVRERAQVASSAGEFLHAVGALHRRLGHERAAARQILLRAHELDPRLSFPRALHQQADAAHPDLLEIARGVAWAQAQGGARR